MDEIKVKKEDVMKLFNALEEFTKLFIEKEEKYACRICGVMRTKDEGGTIFTVCDECWDKKHKVKEEKKESELSKIWIKLYHTELTEEEFKQQITKCFTDRVLSEDELYCLVIDNIAFKESRVNYEEIAKAIHEAQAKKMEGV